MVTLKTPDTVDKWAFSHLLALCSHTTRCYTSLCVCTNSALKRGIIFKLSLSHNNVDLRCFISDLNSIQLNSFVRNIYLLVVDN